MSSESTGRTTIADSESHSNFQLILDALADYAHQTGIDLSQNPFALRLQLINTPTDILELLQEREKAFIKYREWNRFNRTLINCLSPAVRVLHAFSGTLGEAVSLVRRTSPRFLTRPLGGRFNSTLPASLPSS
jgi:hypothetical protein